MQFTGRQGELREHLGKSRVAIVGFCDSSRAMAPYEDNGLAIWGLNRAYIFMQRAEVWFDMHNPAIYTNLQRRPGKHLDWLKGFPGPIYMHRAIPEVPNSVTYPLEAVAETIGSVLWRAKQEKAEGPLDYESGVNAPYLSSSIAFQIGLAIHEGFEEIQLWGVDLNTDSEYAWQKPGVEHLLGIAIGRGIKVILPDNCPLMRGNLYGRGYLTPEGERMSMEQLLARSKALEDQQAEMGRKAAELTGAKRELDFILQQMVPGIDHERVDERRRQMQDAILQLQQKLLQINGARNETAFWIHQTPNGQDPAEAVNQLRSNGNGHKRLDGEGPVTELDMLQCPDMPVEEKLAVGV